jgi:hypothetical protein
VTARRRRQVAVGAALVTLAALAFPQLAFGHALVAREDLPIPAWLFAWAASLVLVVSFFALSAGWRKPRFEEDHWRPFAHAESRVLVNRGNDVVAGAIGVLLLGVAIWAGLGGTEAPDRNFNLTFLFVTCWLGFPLFSVLLGDVFRPFNPWRAIGRAVGAAFTTVARQPPARLAYPGWLGRWPAALGLVAFVWLEVVYGAGSTSAGLTPHTAAIAALIYTGFTLAMMALFGVEKWVERGETFSVYFNMFSQLAPFEVREGRLGWRRPFSAAARWASLPGSVALVVASIGTTAFDGAQEGALENAINNTFDTLVDTGLGLSSALRLTDSLYLLACLLGVAAVYLLGVWGMRSVRNAPSLHKLRMGFAHTLITIAFAYLVAHNFSLFLFQEQAQFSYLLTDPLGDGSNIFGMTQGGIDYGLIGATTVWYVQVGALVVGHVCGLTLAHDRAIAYWGDYQQATRSQYWMLAVMVGFTCFGLYLLSSANQ